MSEPSEIELSFRMSMQVEGKVEQIFACSELAIVLHVSPRVVCTDCQKETNFALRTEDRYSKPG
jgi:hypothetical protein